MKIKHKIIFSFGISILLTGTFLIIFSMYNYRTNTKIVQLRNFYNEMIKNANQVGRTIQHININIEYFELKTDEKQYTEIEPIRKQLKDLLKNLEIYQLIWETKVDSVYTTLLVANKSEYEEYKKLQNEIRYYISLTTSLIEVDYKNNQTQTIRESEKQIYAISEPIEKKIRILEESNSLQIDKDFTALSLATNKYFYLSLSMAVLIILISVFAGIWVYNSINSPIDNLKTCFLQISQGDFSSVEYDKKNEISELIESFNSIASNLHTTQNELKTRNNELLNSNASLVKSKEKAEEADRLKSAFLANMSHEIRTPLNGIIGYADLLKNPNKTPEKQLRYVEMIKNSGKQLLHIINDILDISRIEAGTMKINESVFDLNQILEETRQFFFAETKKRNKNIDIILNKAYDKPIFIKSDEQRLRQILSNLAGNALKYTNVGFIEISYTIKNEFLEFFIKDTGLGISPEKQKSIFDRFNQSTSDVTHSEGGTGLGLSISKGLIEILGGTIWLESIENQGSIFSFTVPFKPDNDLNTSIDLNQHINFNWENKTILIVEDNAINAEFISELLSDTNVKIKYESSGAQAIERCMTDKSIDVVLMDIRLPDLDGYETTQIIKRYRPELPIIAQTAHASEEHRQKCIDAGCSGFISKPLEHNSLLNLLDKYLNQGNA